MLFRSGRTGVWFASHAEGVRPDVITLAKGLGGGLPIGAMIVEPAFTSVLKPGDHGTTFGGNPISTRAALAVIETIEQENLLEHVRVTTEWLFNRLADVTHPALTGVRGRGLWLALVLTDDCAKQVESCALESGFLVNAVRANAIRLAPPLNISQAELESFIVELPGILDEATS